MNCQATFFDRREESHERRERSRSSSASETIVFLSHCASANVVKLSVNINKIATIRNSRGGTVPDPVEAVRVCVAAGAPGITVHPRADARHITFDDVRRIARELAPQKGKVEFNIEGDPRPELIELVREIRPDQLTLVPVLPGEITSQAGWPASTPFEQMSGLVREMQGLGVRVSLFIDPESAAVDWAARLGANRVELYTEPYARAFCTGGTTLTDTLNRYKRTADQAHACGLGVNAGHDLDLENLPGFAAIPHLDEVSIGHALISRAVFVGLETVVREYLAVCQHVNEL